MPRYKGIECYECNEKEHIEKTNVSKEIDSEGKHIYAIYRCKHCGNAFQRENAELVP